LTSVTNIDGMDFFKGTFFVSQEVYTYAIHLINQLYLGQLQNFIDAWFSVKILNWKRRQTFYFSFCVQAPVTLHG